MVVAEDLRVELDPSTGTPVTTTDATPVNGTGATTSSDKMWAFEFAPPDGSTPLRRVFSRERRMFSGGCLEDQERVFAWQDQLWSAYRAHGSVLVGVWEVDWPADEES